MRRSWCFVTLLAAVGLPVLAPGADQDRPVLDPNMPYQARKANPVTYEVDFSVVVTAPYQTRLLKVWLPLASNDPGQEVEKSELSTFPADVKPRIGREEMFGNRFAYFEFARPEGAQVIRHRFRIKVWELHWDVDPDRVAQVDRWPDSFHPYLRSEPWLVVDERFERLARQIVPERRGPARDLVAVMDWANRTLRYDHGAASLQARSEHGLGKGRGHCSDYHGLCASVGRALGHPTRVVYGINAFPKNSPSHCKLEAFLPPYGWVAFDVSETQKLLDRIGKEPGLDGKKRDELIEAARQRLRRGFRENTWFVQTRGTGYELVPPAGKPVPLVRTAYVEADGVPLPDPDPADPNRREFAWMTVYKFTPDREVSHPFQDWSGLLPK